MNSKIVHLLDFISTWYDKDDIFIVFLMMISIAFILNVVLIFTVYGYSIAKRSWFVFYSLALTLLFSAILYKDNVGNRLSLLLAFISSVYCIPCFSFPVRQNKMKSEHLNLARIIDRAVDVSKIKPYDFPLNTARKSAEKPLESTVPPLNKALEGDSNACGGLDFSHVKNVIARLEYFGLSVSDKRQVGELESYIRTAERTGGDEEVKMKINDGLGALLKIMSKYGV